MSPTSTKTPAPLASYCSLCGQGYHPDFDVDIVDEPTELSKDSQASDSFEYRWAHEQCLDDHARLFVREIDHEELAEKFGGPEAMSDEEEAQLEAILDKQEELRNEERHYLGSSPEKAPTHPLSPNCSNCGRGYLPHTTIDITDAPCGDRHPWVHDDCDEVNAT